LQEVRTLLAGALSADRSTACDWLDFAQATAIRTGARWLSDEATRVRSVMAQGGHEPLGPLTAREQEIAALAGGGYRTREIAERLFLSPRTVDAHLAHIYRKLNVTSRTAMAVILSRAPSRGGSLVLPNP
jgi:DNA-binding NarL/FixJ family response regulator